jgi:hypothetical protein
MTTKRCCRCRNDLPLGDFSKHRGNSLQGMCRPCNREYQREHYQRNREAYLTYAVAWRDARREENVASLVEYFATHPCVDCGESDPLVLHFDHQGGKVVEVSNLVYRGLPWPRVLAEIEKCDVRCASCHFTRHARDGGWLKLKLARGPRSTEVRLPAPQQPSLRLIFQSPDAQAGKWCGVCGRDLPLGEFSIKAGTRRASKCKACQRAYSREHYRNNRALYLARVRLRHQMMLAENMALVIEYFRTHPCVDCGEKNPVQLLFDHVRGVKSRNLAQMIRDGVSWRRVEEEIAKCDVRCFNCHARRHSLARNTWKQRKIVSDANRGVSTIGSSGPIV